MPADEDVLKRADALFEEAQARSEAGDDDAALGLYLESLALDRHNPPALYNVGLIYKYRRDWEHCRRYNQLAIEQRPDDQATNWNLAIAATALRDWTTARQCWRRVGIDVKEGDEAIVGKFGYTPVRLNGFEEGQGATEVVWAQRLSPVTARVDNIPTPDAKFRFGDVVLHDGAGVGTRIDDQGREYSVFNVFELFEASAHVTVDAHLEVPDEAAAEALEKACDALQLKFEDWSTLRHLCRACSEGRAHDAHDHDEPGDEWQVSRRVGFATPTPDMVATLLERWRAAGPARAVVSLEF